MPKQRITIDLTTTSSTEDVFSALALLNPTDLTITTKVVSNGHAHAAKKIRGPRGPYRKRRPHRKRGTYEVNRERPARYQDARLVWDSVNGVIDINATLSNLGLTREELIKLKTRRGTVESSLRSAIAQGRG